METYEKFYKTQFARFQKQDFHAKQEDPQRAFIFQYHGVAVLSPLFTVAKRQEMQLCRQKASELNEKKRSLQNSVQQIIDTVKGKNFSTHHAEVDATNSTVGSSLKSDVIAKTKDAQDPYIMSLQNLLKKSREYIEREHSRQRFKNSSKASSLEDKSSNQNDAIKLSESLKEKARLIKRSRSCSPIMVFKPTLNKTNALLQVSSGQSNNTSPNVLPNLSKSLSQEILSRGGTVLDEDLRRSCMLDCESSITSLTCSYAKLPSPELSLSPKMHRKHTRPLSIGNVAINLNINAYNLNHKENFKIMGLGRVDASDGMPNLEEHSKGLSSKTIHFCGENVDLVTKLSKPFQGDVYCIKNNQDNRVDDMRNTTDSPNIPLCKGQMLANLSSTNAYENSIHIQNPYSGTFVHGIHKSCVLNSATELNKSYDVEAPSSNCMQSQNTNRSTENGSVSLTKEQYLDSSLDIQFKHHLEHDLESAQNDISEPYMEEDKSWIQEQRSCSISLRIPITELSRRSPCDDDFKKMMLSFEESRKRLEEQQAYKLSLLLVEQEKFQRGFEEEEHRLKFKEFNNPVVYGNRYKAKSENSVPDNILNLHDNIGINTAASQHTYGSMNESSFSIWGPPERQGPKISSSRPRDRQKTRWSQVYSAEMQSKFKKITALAKGFLTRRLMQTEKLKNLKQTVKDTADFMRTFHNEPSLSKGIASAQDASLHERVNAQLRAALYEIHHIIFEIDTAERMNILAHNRELQREKIIRQLEKIKSPRDRLTLSSATQKSLDRKKLNRKT